MSSCFASVSDGICQKKTLRLQSYYFFLIYANILVKKVKKSAFFLQLWIFFCNFAGDLGI